MSLIEVVKVVFKRKYFVLVCVLLAFFAGVVVNYTILDATYEATAVVAVEAPGHGAVNMERMVRMAKSRRVMRRAAELLSRGVGNPDSAGDLTGHQEESGTADSAGEQVEQATPDASGDSDEQGGQQPRQKAATFDVDKTARTLLAGMKTSTDAESGELRITFSTSDAELCAKYANAVAGAFEEIIKEESLPAGDRALELLARAQALESELQEAKERGASQDVSAGARLDREMEVARGAVNLVETGACAGSSIDVMVKDVVKAQVPTEPLSPKRERNVFLFLLCGLVAGIAVALGIERSEKAKAGIPGGPE